MGISDIFSALSLEITRTIFNVIIMSVAIENPHRLFSFVQKTDKLAGVSKENSRGFLKTIE